MDEGKLRVRAPDGEIIRFPKDTPPETISKAMGEYWASKQNKPTPPGYGGADVDTSPPDPKEQVRRYSLGAKAGIMEPILGIQQMVSKLIGGKDADQMQSRVDEFNKNFKAQGGDTPEAATGHLVGGIAATAPTMAIPALGAARFAPRLAAGAATGGAISAATPVESGADFWPEKSKQAATGAAVGAGGTAVASGLARVISPKVNPDVDALRSAGVVPTPGETMGGVFRNLEEKARSIPVIGSMIAKRETGAIHEWNVAKVNEALAPLNVKVDTKVAGHDLIAEGIDKASKPYRETLPGLTVNVDRQLATDVATVRADVSLLPKTQRDQFTKIANEKFTGKLGSGAIDGETAKEIDSSLGKLAADYRKDLDTDKRKLGEAVGGLQMAFRDAIKRSNPAAAETLSKADQSYAMMLRVQDAANRGKEGVFTPAQLLAASTGMDTSLRKRASAKGEALMQEGAESARRVLGNFEPDSGTAGRLAILGLGAGGAGAYGYNDPEGLAKAAGIGAMGVLPYTRGGNRFVNAMLTDRGAAGNPATMAGLLRRLGPTASVGLLDGLE